jgi:hypothetical protein
MIDDELVQISTVHESSNATRGPEIGGLSSKGGEDFPTVAHETKFTFESKLDKDRRKNPSEAPVQEALVPVTSNKPPTRTKLTDFWTAETVEERAKHDAQELEEIYQNAEECALAEARAKLRRRDIKRAQERERSRRY